MAWQRAGRDSRKGKGFTFTPQKMRQTQAIIKDYAALAMRDHCRKPLEGPLKFTVDVWRHPPKGWSRAKQAELHWITTRPDFDNHMKIIADALSGMCMKDDAQIAQASFCKRYCLQSSPECVAVQLEELRKP
jgi:Holliday junction resolvase RusA-like endonuclease